MNESPVISQGLTLFTIAASNYLAHASVLGASVSEHHPGHKLVVFLLDTPPAGLPVPQHLVLVPAALALERSEWNHRQAHYGILEFATSVKPACMRHLFRQGVRRAIYLDPDIRLFQRVDQFWLDHDGDDALVLTPHILSPLPKDGCWPNDLSIMRAGLYNLGFAAMRNTPEACALLDWWDDKLHRHCLQDVREGVFTDQKWMDYAPLLLRDSAVLAHPGFNVAYWNLHERIPRLIDGRWQVEDPAGQTRHDLVFFHFSGFSPGQDRISVHEDRFRAQPPGDVPTLLSDYARDLLAAGAQQFASVGLPPTTFADGLTWDAVCRQLYRQGLADGQEFGDPLAQPRFLDWALACDADDHVSRYVRVLLQMRPDLATAYDDGRDTAALLAWMRDRGPDEMGLDARLVERIAGAAGTGAVGVNYVGYLRAHLGVGEAARQSIRALHAAGVAVRAHDVSAQAAVPVGDYELPVSAAADAARITLLGCNADALPGVLHGLPQDLSDTYRIGCWYWETPEFPEQWTDRFDLVDEVWVATGFIAEAVRAKATVPVVVMPPMVQTGPARPGRDRAWLRGLLPEVAEDEFIFLFQFDVASVAYRKNPEGVIAAFRQAFSVQQPVRLVLKLINGQADPAMVQRLERDAAGQRICLLDEALPREQSLRLLASVDCFVSLHRSEGFGLSIAEAMACGLPVVAAGWGGNADFCHPGNCALVPYDLMPSTQAHGPYPAGTLWAQPRLDVAAQLMHRVWADPAWRATIAQAGAATIEQRYGAAAVGPAMRARIERISRSARVRWRRQQAPAPGAAMQAVQSGKPTLSVATMVRIVGDVLRFPGYYLTRLPRLPGRIWRSGVADTLAVAGIVAAGPPELKQQYRVSSLLDTWMRRWRRWRSGHSHGG